ncbi:MAG: flippase-like domain-containing protein [Nevskia sp.]|nr:flippase-like domain-containing protein [Nevskia sp.]
MKYSRGRLLLVAALGMGAYLAALAVVDRAQLLGAMRVLSPATLLAVFGLSLCNYFLRLLRWDAYLRAIGPAVPTLRQGLYYFAGFAFTVTPGKLGEAVRALYLRRHGIAYAQTTAVLLVERLLDLMAVSLLALLWLTRDRHGAWFAAGFLLVVAVAAVLVSRPSAPQRLRAAAARRSGRSARLLEFLAHSLGDAASLLSLPRLAWGLALGLLAWGAEGLGLYLLVQALGIPLGAAGAVGAYSLGVLAGAASFIPGGLGGAEAAMSLLLTLAGGTAAAALTATVVCRLATLWFAVALGALAMLALELLGASLPQQEASA